MAELARRHAGDGRRANGYDAIVVGGGPQRADGGGLPRAGRAAGRGRGGAGRRRRRGRDRGPRRASGCRRWPTRSAGSSRRSCASWISRSHGLSLVAPEVRVFAPQPDGRAVTLCADLGKTGRRACARSRADDGDHATSSSTGGSGRWRGSWRTSGTRRRRTSRRRASATRWSGCGSGAAFRGLGREDGRTILRVLAMAVADFVGESFASEPIRAVTAWRGVRYTAMGPWSAGLDGGAARGRRPATTAARAGRDRVRPGRPVGACPRRSPAAARAAGAEIRLNARGRGRHDARRGGHGVALASGEELAAPAVVSGLDPKRLLTTLRRPRRDRAVDALAGRQHPARRATVAKVNLVLDGLPALPAAAGDARLAARPDPRRGAVHRRRRARRSTPSKYGLLPASPVLEATIPSLVDPLAGRRGARAART